MNQADGVTVLGSAEDIVSKSHWTDGLVHMFDETYYKAQRTEACITSTVAEKETFLHELLNSLLKSTDVIFDGARTILEMWHVLEGDILSGTVSPFTRKNLQAQSRWKTGKNEGHSHRSDVIHDCEKDDAHTSFHVTTNCRL